MHQAPERSGLRAGLLGLAAAVLGVAAHSGAGGATGLTVTTLLAGAAVVAVTAALATRPPDPWRTAAVLAAGQVVLHLAQGHGSGHAAVDPHGMHGIHGMAAAPPPGPTADLLMLAAHVAVAVVVACGIVHADRALGATLRRLTRRVVAVLSGPAPRPLLDPPVRPVRARDAVAVPGAVLTRLPPRRGPPSGRHVPTSHPLRKDTPCPTRGRRAPSPA